MPSIRTACVVEAFEDMENGMPGGPDGLKIARGWNSSAFNLIVPGFGSTTSFLGYFAQGQRPRKTFQLTPASTNVRVKFDFLQLSSWDGCSMYGPDNFKVFVNDKLVDFGCFYFAYYGTVDDVTLSGTTSDGVIWTRSFVRKVPDFDTEIHEMTMDIPLSLITTGSLTLEFFADVNEGDANEVAGIDNLKVISCPQNKVFPAI